METNCKDCNRLIDECTCLEETVDFPKYTRDQKRRAVEEIYRRLTEFDSAIKLIRQFDICEQDLIEYTTARAAAANNDPRYTISSDPALTTSPAYDPYTGQPIGKWAVEAWKPRPGTTFDQAVEEATELRTRAMQAALARIEQGMSNPYKDWVTIEELEERTNQAARARALQGLTPKASRVMALGPNPDLKSYTDWA